MRRIVERAMAAVALAEAQSTRSVAEMEMKLVRKDSELAQLRAEYVDCESRFETARADEPLRAQVQAAMEEKRLLLAQVAAKTEAADSAERRANDLASRAASLEFELERATKILAESREALDRHAQLEAELTDSVARLAAMLAQARSENAEMQSRMEAYQSRASMAEEALKAVPSAPGDSEMASRDRAWSETVATLAAARASLESSLVAVRSELAASRAAMDAARGENDSRVAALKELLAARDRLLTESAAAAGGDIEAVRAENARLQDRIASLQNRAKVIEDAMKSEHEKLSSAAADLDSREALLRESTAAAVGAMAALRDESARNEERITALQTRARMLEESMRTEALRAAGLDSELAELRRKSAFEEASMRMQENALALAHHNADSEVESMKDRLAAMAAERDALSQTIESLRTAADRSATDMRMMSQERDALAESVDRAHAERDSAVAELAANRREMVDSLRVMEESARAMKSLRAERDAALALAAQQPRAAGADTRLEEALRRIAEYERELAALRTVLMEGAAGPEPVKPGPWTGPLEFQTQPPPPTQTPETPPAPAVPGRPAVPLLQELNTASFEDLAAIPEVGPTRARAILWYRDNIGALKSEEDLKSVPGFNDERIKALKEWWGRQEEHRP